MTPILVFDIETVPDVAGLRVLYPADAGLSDAQVAQAAFERRRAVTGNDFLPLHLHRVVAISCALRDRESFRIWSLGQADEPERDLLQRFYDGIEKYTPQMVSWNGSGFDLPVLNYRALIHEVRATRFWETGEDDREFKWNNYISRYHFRHLDLMDVLAMYQGRGNAPLDQMAQLLGLPGKLGLDGSKVWDAYQAGRIGEIRNYCETDVANTYLVFLKFQKLRGHYDAGQYQKELDLVRTTLSNTDGGHWKEFLSAWPRKENG
ncbi:MAG: 3'-5' exonuclease [Burkholderiales bacterium]